MFIFKFAVLNIAALMTIVAGTFKILDEHQPNVFYTILIIFGASLLFIKTYNYCFHWGSEPKERKKTKRKKKQNPITKFFMSIYEVFDYFFKGIYKVFDYFLGWAVAPTVFFLFVTIIAWVSN